ncbi:MAG: DnaJ domain-containing protein [Proteobacteria bacterium]|nr:DnaJ domain-containing protein [Pseudomonadota bacterium]
MDIEKCLKILEVDRSASPDEIKQAYKDTVNVWHPDRFSSNPRLQQKAEEKLKEVNIAYETLKSYLSSEQEPKQKKPETDVKTGTVKKTKDKAEYQKTQPNAKSENKTEAFVEAGTGIALNLWSHLSSLFKSIATEITKEIKQGKFNQSQRDAGGSGRGKRRGKGMGGGRGMGRGGGRRSGPR